VLDVGCGTGRLTRLLAARAGHVEAIDADATMIAIAREVTPRNVSYLHADVMTRPLEAGSYDARESPAGWCYRSNWLRLSGTTPWASASPRADFGNDQSCTTTPTTSHARPRRAADHASDAIPGWRGTSRRPGRLVLWRYLLTWRKTG
jgi:SAM-dependent methyltransferase